MEGNPIDQSLIGLTGQRPASAFAGRNRPTLVANYLARCSASSANDDLIP